MREHADRVQRDDLLAAASAFAAAVALVATDGPAGRALHLTASVMPLPGSEGADPSVSVVIALPANIGDVAVANGELMVSVCAAGSQQVAQAIAAAAAKSEAAGSGAVFDAVGLSDAFVDTEHGPILRDAAATLRCRITTTLPLPSHSVVVADVVEANSAPHHDPLLFLRDTYRHVEELPKSMFPMFTFATPRPERIERAR